MIDQRYFSVNLRRIMETLGMSQEELAKKIGVSAGGVSLIVNGKNDPNLSTLVKILNVIPVKFEILVEPPMGEQS